MKYFATLAVSVFVLSWEFCFGGDTGGGPGSQGQNLPNGTAMPLGKFQEDLRLCQSVPLITSCP